MDDFYQRALILYKEKNYKDAYKKFLEGYQNGCPECMYVIGVFKYKAIGEVVEKDEKEGRELILKAIPLISESDKENKDLILSTAFSNFLFLQTKYKDLYYQFLLNRFKANQASSDEIESLAYLKSINDPKGENWAEEICILKEGYEKTKDPSLILKAGMIYGICSEMLDPTFSNCFSCLLEANEKGSIVAFEYLTTNIIKAYLKNVLVDGEIIDKTLEILSKADKDGFKPIEKDLCKALLTFFYIDEEEGLALIKQTPPLNFEETDGFNGLCIDIYPESINNKIANKFEKLYLALLEVILEKGVKNFETSYYCPIANFYSLCLTSPLLSKKEINDFRKKYNIYINKAICENDSFACEIHALNIINKVVDEPVSRAIELLATAIERRPNDYEMCNILASYYETVPEFLNYEKSKELYFRVYQSGEPFYMRYAGASLLYLDSINEFLSSDLKKEIMSFLISYPNEYFIFSNNWISDKKHFFIAEFEYKYRQRACSYGECYLNGEGVEKDVLKALEIFENDNGIDRDISLYNVALIYFEGKYVQKDSKKALELLLKIDQIEGSRYLVCFETLIAEIYLEKDSTLYNPKEALIHLLKAEKANKLTEDPELYYLLGKMYGSETYGCKDLNKAKLYYEKSISQGFNCEFALESTNRDIVIEKLYFEGIEEGKSKSLKKFALIKYAKSYARTEFAKQTEKGLQKYGEFVISKNKNSIKRKAAITKFVKDEMSDIWESLPEQSKSCIITSIYLYICYIELGYEEYSDLDFSPVINQICKAFEVVLKKFFLDGYLTYLKENKIDFKEFVDEAATIQLPFIETKINIFNNKAHQIFSYSENCENKNFSLGQVFFIVTSGSNKSFWNRFYKNQLPTKGVKSRNNILSDETINKHIVDYFSLLFDETMFPKYNYQEEVANYLIDLANDVKTIKNFRNLGSHECRMSVEEAESTVDYLLFVRKIIYNFISKIKQKYRQGYKSNQ